jgi:hypothetical protein
MQAWRASVLCAALAIFVVLAGVGDAWASVSMSNAPLSAVNFGTTLSTGSLMLVWGGYPATNLGGRYDPIADTWTPISTEGVPLARYSHSAVWTGHSMIVWGGDHETGGTGKLDSDGEYVADPDLDGDGYSGCQGDCNDRNSAVKPGAAEICNAIDDNCNGLIDEDASGVDSDGDGVHNACDNCGLTWNPNQTDVDHNGQGDACDLSDGLIYVRSSDDKNHIEWQFESAYTSWNIYRGSLAVLRATAQYTQIPGSNPLAAHDCGVSDPQLLDLAVPAPGEVEFNLVTGVAGGVESSLGTNSAGVPRANANPCP